jgi:hypothetical protein
MLQIDTCRKPRPTRLTPIERESQLKINVMKAIRSYLNSGHLAWHTPNGGFRNPREAAQFKAFGVLPGVLDIQILSSDGKCSEETRATLSEAQRASEKWCHDHDVAFCVAHIRLFVEMMRRPQAFLLLPDGHHCVCA